MGLLNPTEAELKECGLSRESYMENWIHLSKVSGMDKWSKTYSYVFYFLMNFTCCSVVGFIVGAAFEGDKVGTLEGLQYLMINSLIYSGNASFHWYHDEYMTILRTMDHGIFNYEGTVNEEIQKELEGFRARARSHKKTFSLIYLVNQSMIVVGLLSKKPVMYLINGRGEKLVDGENNLVRQGPFSMYMPFANYWVAYIFSLTYSNTFLVLVCISTMGFLVTYQFISEDLLSEFAMVDKTLNTCVIRAERLFNIRFQGKEVGDQQSSQNAMDECLRFCLNLSIKHHHRTLKCYNMFKQIMFVPCFVLIIAWALMVCMSIYLILNDDVSLAVKLPLPALISSECVVCLMICYYGELLTNASESIGRSIYNGERWSTYSRVVKPYMAITRCYCYIPNSLTAGGFGQVNHATFANLCSTAYSYMGFLLST